MRILVYISLFIPYVVVSQNSSFTAISEKNVYSVGEPIPLFLNLEVPSDQRIDSVYFQLSGNRDSLGNNWELWNTSNITKTTSLTDENDYVTNYSQELVIANFDTGKFEFPPCLAFLDSTTLYSNAIPFTIQLVQTEENKIKNIKPIFEVNISFFEYFLYYLKKFGWWIVLCIALAIATYFLIKKWKSKSEEINMEPQIPLEVQLLERLHSLKTKKLWENGHFKAYYSELSEVIWSFVAYRYQIPTFEKTSNEILESLKWVSIDNTYLKELNTFFTLSDGVKFAKINPLEKDNIQAIEMAIKFIENERLDIKEAENEHVE